MLCYRCQHRVNFLENGSRPRYECGEIQSSKYICYMFKPIAPVVLTPNEGDDRPIGGPTMISARVHWADNQHEDEFELVLDELGDKEYAMYYVKKAPVGK